MIIVVVKKKKKPTTTTTKTCQIVSQATLRLKPFVLWFMRLKRVFFANTISLRENTEYGSIDWCQFIDVADVKSLTSLMSNY